MLTFRDTNQRMSLKTSLFDFMPSKYRFQCSLFAKVTIALEFLAYVQCLDSSIASR